MEKKYVCIYKFKDLEDENHIYEINDKYPREGLEPSKARIKELSSKKNKIGEKLIQEVKEDTKSIGKEVNSNTEQVDSQVQEQITESENEDKVEE